MNYTPVKVNGLLDDPIVPEFDPKVVARDGWVISHPTPFVSQAKFTSIGTESNRQPPVYKTGVLPLNYRCVA